MTPPGHHLDTSLANLRIDKGKKLQPRSSPWGPLAIFLLLAAAGGGGFFYYTKTHAPVAVKVVELNKTRSAAAPEGTEEFVSTGYVVPRSRVDVSSQIIGRVVEVFVEEGQKIEKGATLIRLQDDESKAQLAQAKARVNTAKAQLAELRAGSRPQQIETSRAALQSAAAQLEKARADYERFRPLFDQRAISAQELDQMRAAFDVAKANHESAGKQFELVKIGPRVEEIAAAEARLAEAEGSVDFVKTQLDHTVIKAPISGTILEKIADLGELVTNANFGGTSRGAKTAVVSMADLNDLQVETNVKESNISKVKLGQKAQISLDTHPNEKFEGVVDEISPQSDRQLGSVKVKVKILMPKDIRPDVNARVGFLAEAAPVEAAAAAAEAIWIPEEALVGGDAVFLVVKDRALKRTVKTGKAAGGKVPVTDGLVGTERLIAPPPAGLKDGAAVTMESAPAK